MEKKTNSGTAEFVCGLLSILIPMMPYIALPLGIIAVAIAKSKDNTNPTGLSKAGFVLGIIGIVINSIVAFFVFSYMLYVAI